MADSAEAHPRFFQAHGHSSRAGILQAAGDTDPGLSREVNEDRFYLDDARGLVMVIDGLGGQAAGGKAADTALAMLRTRLERETGPVAERVREAIAIANNEIYRLARQRPEWKGMACVLTVGVVDGNRALIGHVGDTRLYKLRGNGIEKITRDHSPVGEREDAREISEIEAMTHPRRNEVYRDIGSDLHDPGDPGFIDTYDVAFEPDAALLLCSDGLSDLVRSATIKQIAWRFAGNPRQVVRALIDAANDAGGKDNITVVYMEGEQFARRAQAALLAAPVEDRRGGGSSSLRTLLQGSVLAALVAGVVALRLFGDPALPSPVIPGLARAGPPVLVVQPGESIAAAIERAAAGSDVIVEPGEYRERLLLRDGVRVLSRIPRAATIRLPSSASEADPAVVANGPMTAELVGFRIVGDAATPLGTGVLIRDATLAVVNVEITGAARAALDITGDDAVVIGSDIHDNQGMALHVRSGASPRVTHNAFLRNGLSARSVIPLMIEQGARPMFTGNVFDLTAARIIASDEAMRTALQRHNWFVGLSTRGRSLGAGPSDSSRGTNGRGK